MRLQNIVNPRRTRIQRLVIVAFTVFVGLLLTQALWPAAAIAYAIAGAVWAAVGIVIANWFLEGTPW